MLQHKAVPFGQVVAPAVTKKRRKEGNMEKEVEIAGEILGARRKRGRQGDRETGRKTGTIS
eukprot:1750963-Rhodomonas_salina.1